MSQIAVTLVNWLVAMLVPPRPLPRMDFSTGIPADARAVVAVPAMLASHGGHRAPRRRRSRCAISPIATRTCDSRSSPTSSTRRRDVPGRRRAARRGDRRDHRTERPLRARSPPTEQTRTGGDVFFLLHRPRALTTRSEGAWMGDERKRGKLAALNALICRERRRAAALRDDRRRRRPACAASRYVITLDADTDLPRDAARELVGDDGAPAQPAALRRAARARHSGYGILQPRVAASLAGANRSRFARLFGGEPGIDPYTRTVSDAYQDAFGEGSFVGKGIYDVEAFERALDGRFPDNRILSHDLLEGSYARSGLVTDVQLYDDYPARYSGDVGRRRRWIRGDWQLAGWLLPPRAGRRSGQRRAQSAALARAVEAVRQPAAQPRRPGGDRCCSCSAFTVLEPAAAWVDRWRSRRWQSRWSSERVHGLLAKSPDLDLRRPFPPGRSRGGAARRAARVRRSPACRTRPRTASARSCARTGGCWFAPPPARMDASSEQDRRDPASLRASFAIDVAGPGARLRIGRLARRHATRRCSPLGRAVPAVVARFAGDRVVARPPAGCRARSGCSRTSAASCGCSRGAPGRGSRRSSGRKTTGCRPTTGSRCRCRPSRIARRRRTSGMALLADLAAYDFGYLTADRLLERTAAVLATLRSLERHRGHFYNWYDTQSLQPLAPRYVSTVDSGNLAGHLITLRAGPRRDRRRSAGLGAPARRPARHRGRPRRRARRSRTGGARAAGRARSRRVCKAAPATPAAMHAALVRVDAARAAPPPARCSPATQPTRRAQTLHTWVAALRRQCDGTGALLAHAAPWADLAAPRSLRRRASRCSRRSARCAGSPR